MKLKKNIQLKHDSLEKNILIEMEIGKHRKHKTSSKIKIGQKSSIHQEGMIILIGILDYMELIIKNVI